jgi:2-polyprenyl-3-methyl-5-hydroxy-6-metoxy-1,4-benzoquinol methylase
MAVGNVYANLVAEHGLAHSHRLVLDAVPAGSWVLDVGCSTGYLAAALAKRGSTTVGVELDPDAAAVARGHCERVIVGDIEAAEVRDQLPKGFDAIVFADVLEHLRDPWTVLAFSRLLLAPGGLAVLSLPNIAHWTGRRAMLRGLFPYASHGLFDRTHLRFFTRQSAHDLASRAGYRVAAERFSTSALPLETQLRRCVGGTEEAPIEPIARLRARTAARFPGLFAFQFVLTLEPTEAS